MATPAWYTLWQIVSSSLDVCGRFVASSANELPGIKPADPDETDAQGEKGGDPRQPLEACCVKDENLKHREQDQDKRADAPAALSGPGSPGEEAERHRNGEERA